MINILMYQFCSCSDEKENESECVWVCVSLVPFLPSCLCLFTLLAWLFHFPRYVPSPPFLCPLIIPASPPPFLPFPLPVSLTSSPSYSGSASSIIRYFPLPLPQCLCLPPSPSLQQCFLSQHPSTSLSLPSTRLSHLLPSLQWCPPKRPEVSTSNA